MTKVIADIHFRNIPEETYDALRDYAHHNRISMKQAFIDAIAKLTEDK